jgi:hypothetical protein
MATAVSAAPGRAGAPGAGPLVGDTLSLVSVGPRTLPDWSPGNGRCTEAEVPAIEGIVFRDDSTYAGMSVARPRCRPVGLPDTTRWTARYRLRDDTLTLYREVAEGWEEWFNGGVAMAGVQQLSVEATSGGSSRADKPRTSSCCRDT